MTRSRYSDLVETLSRDWKWSVLILVGVSLHAIGIGRPFLGHFAQHQTDYATVVQRWLATGWNPLDPAMRWLAYGKCRHFFGDLPLNMTVVTLFCQWTHASIEFAGRGLSFVYFLASLFPVYRIARSIFEDRGLALTVLTFYVFSPLTLIYSQLFLLEMPALCFTLWGWYLFLMWWQGKGAGSKTLIFSAAFWALCFMTRTYFVLLLIPIFVIFVHRYRGAIFKRGEVYLFFLTALLPLFLWQGFATWMASRAKDESSLLDNLRVFVAHKEGYSIFVLEFRQYLLLLRSLVFKIATPLGLLFSLLAIPFHESKRRPWVLFLVGTFAAFSILFFIAPRKLIDYEYYFMPLVPVFCLLPVFFLEFLMARWKLCQRLYTVALLAIVLLALRFSLPSVLTIPPEDRCVLPMAQEVRRVSPRDARVITSHGVSSSFLYYTDRDGWAFPLQEGFPSFRNKEDEAGLAVERLERFRRQGAAYFAMVNPERVSLNKPLFDHLNQNYTLIFRSNCGLIYSLKGKK